MASFIKKQRKRRIKDIIDDKTYESNTPEDPENDIKHWGILGMKWGGTEISKS